MIGVWSPSSLLPFSIATKAIDVSVWVVVDADNRADAVDVDDSCDAVSIRSGE